MIIKSVDIVGFLGRKSPVRIAFHDDLNIITGYNGAGKTNLLKLIWYTISGNTHALLKEVSFASLVIHTTNYMVSIHKVNSNTCRGTIINSDGAELDVEDTGDDEDFSDARDRFNEFLIDNGSSIFFPTFRRIEGGFTITDTPRSRTNLLFNTARAKGDLPEAIAAVSRKLSNQAHTFITSISTIDVAEFLLRQFNEMSEEAAAQQTKMSQDVINEIRNFRIETQDDDTTRTGREAVETLERITTLIESGDRERERVMAPLNAVQELVSKIFRHKGIQINRRVSFGDTVNAISSDLLSAGEKQMLSFICYNAFTNDSPIFIDEPELSLHVDWQRILFPTLESQKTRNQFIIATHSPFIYGKYPEKEIALAEDRGEGMPQDA